MTSPSLHLLYTILLNLSSTFFDPRTKALKDSCSSLGRSWNHTVLTLAIWCHTFHINLCSSPSNFLGFCLFKETNIFRHKVEPFQTQQLFDDFCQFESRNVVCNRWVLADSLDHLGKILDNVGVSCKMTCADRTNLAASSNVFFGNLHKLYGTELIISNTNKL